MNNYLRKTLSVFLILVSLMAVVALSAGATSTPSNPTRQHYTKYISFDAGASYSTTYTSSTRSDCSCSIYYRLSGSDKKLRTKAASTNHTVSSGIASAYLWFVGTNGAIVQNDNGEAYSDTVVGGSYINSGYNYWSGGPTSYPNRGNNYGDMYYSGGGTDSWDIYSTLY